MIKGDNFVPFTEANAVLMEFLFIELNSLIEIVNDWLDLIIQLINVFLQFMDFDFNV